MISRALFAGAATAFLLAFPASGAGVVNIAADQVPTCQPAAYDLDLSLAVLTPSAMCVDMDPAAYEVAPAASAAPAATPDDSLVADTVVADDLVTPVVPVARIARPLEIVPLAQLVPVRAVPVALTASLPKPAANERPAFSNDRLWMIGVYR